MNGTIPATVNSREGSLETREAEGTAVWPLLTKKSIQRLVISCDFITWLLTLQYSLHSWFPDAGRQLVVAPNAVLPPPEGLKYRNGSGRRPAGRRCFSFSPG